MTKPLSKSRFKIGAECPTKLYYSVRPEYGNSKTDDEFMKALAEGGFQVGELAMLYYPGGTKVETLDYDESVRQTDELLKNENVIIYEAALRFENLFVRVDVLVKKGNQLELIEVKAKSFDFAEAFEAFDKRALKRNEFKLKADWRPYVLDVAFQTFVCRKSKPEFTVKPFLMLADKSQTATADGLNQLFLIGRGPEGRTSVTRTREVTTKELGVPVLSRVDLSSIVDSVITKAKVDWADGFLSLVQKLSALMKSGERFEPTVGSGCKGCEFRVESAPGVRSGFEECWAHAKKLKPNDFKQSFVFDVWDFRGAENAIAQNKIFASDLTEDDLKMKERADAKVGFSRTERQLIQVQAAQGKVSKPVILASELAEELAALPAPYHFIDFETAMVAIPFHAGRKPYEQMAYQFSHHVVDKVGKVSHRSEYLDDRKGQFPNFDFVRALKKALDGDDGTVFRFAAHENTVLNQIHAQLGASAEADRDELRAWIESLTTPSATAEFGWTPRRKFIDMRDLIVGLCYLPTTEGSNSIKAILPAVLAHAGQKLVSKFPDVIRFDASGGVEDPYKSLPPIFSDMSRAEFDRVAQRLVDNEDLNNGGGAMLAWSRMQFGEMAADERVALREALLRYCRLDTLAMVVIWEWWMLELRRAGKRVA